MTKSSKLAAVAAACLTLTSLASGTQAATYGCFKVTADSINIRARPYSNRRGHRRGVEGRHPGKAQAPLHAARLLVRHQEGLARGLRRQELHEKGRLSVSAVRASW